MGEGIHWIDWCHAVVGRPITQVHAVATGGGGSSNPGDSFVLSLSFSDGSIATITYAADGDRGMAKERCEVFGAGQCAVIEDWSKGVLYQRGKTRALEAPRGQQKGTVEQLEAFVAALQTGEPAVSMDVTLHVHHAALRARDSLRDQQPRAVAWPRPVHETP